tara:strand:- start:1288 stop:1668 length:381 start_codon:yes stop_codon:yes gene_type:complete
MSNQAMMKMLERATSDAAFATGLVESVGNKEGAAALDAVTAYGNANGYEITQEDATEMQRQLMDSTNTPDGDLDDSDLENVSGGVGALAGLLGGGALNNILDQNWRMGGGVRAQDASPLESFIKKW